MIQFMMIHCGKSIHLSYPNDKNVELVFIAKLIRPEDEAYKSLCPRSLIFQKPVDFTHSNRVSRHLHNLRI